MRQRLSSTFHFVIKKIKKRDFRSVCESLAGIWSSNLYRDLPLSVLSLPQKICIIESPAIAIVVTVFALFYIWELCQVFFLAWRGFFPVRNLINQPSTLAFRSVWSPALWSKRDHQQWNHKTPSGKKLITPAKIGEQSSLGL